MIFARNILVTATVDEKGFFKVLQALNLISQCTHREALQSAIREYVIPLMEDGFNYFDPRGAKNFEAPLLDCPGITKEDRDLIYKYFQKDTLAKLMLTKNEQNKPLSLKNQAVHEWVYPHIMQKIKSLMLAEELAKSKATISTLMKSPAAIAIVNKDMLITSCNRSFRDLFQTSDNELLPESLSKVINTNAAPMPSEDDENPGTEISFLSLPKGNFKLVYFELENKHPDIERMWLLRIHPASDPFTKSNMLIQKAGLTWREMEICCLIHDGLGRQEIAERLFISTHTVKTHLKKIHKKLGVNSRTQLVAYLNQHSDDSYEKQFSQ